MREFIETLVGDKKLDFRYKDYDSLFVKQDYDSYYLFYFLEDKSQLIILQKEAVEIFNSIKSNKELYKPDMDKNTTCIFFLPVTEQEYYEIGENGEISELSKIICLVEENLNYFKKNVFLYTDKMKKFAQQNKGKFQSICSKYFTEYYFEKYKESCRNSYEYDFLINLFIKIPFLSFYTYQPVKQKEYQTMEAFIEQKCKEAEINKSHIEKISDRIEVLDNEEELYEWVDALLEEENKKGAIENEN